MPKMLRGLEPPFEPLLCQAAITRFASLIDKDSVVLEYGAGASTLWLARRTWLTVSVEHDEEWYDEVATRADAANATVYLVTDLSKYAAMADEFPDRMFDVVFVDGPDKLRRGCIRAAIPKLRPGGWMIVDDTDWRMLQPGLVILQDWEREEYRGTKFRWARVKGKIVWQQVRGVTSFFRKPEEG